VKRILVIEDNETNLRLMEEILTLEGYEVLLAENAEDGIVIAKREIPDLILMDIQLPGMSGVEALRILKGDERTRQIKVVALTAFAMSGDRERFLQAGFDGYISKPYRYMEVLGIIKTFLQEKQR
jgi:two-component system cell cycle response regulator DivK